MGRLPPFLNEVKKLAAGLHDRCLWSRRRLVEDYTVMKKWICLLASLMLAVTCMVAQAEGLPNLVDVMLQNGAMESATSQADAEAVAPSSQGGGGFGGISNTDGSSATAPSSEQQAPAAEPQDSAELEINPNAKLTLMVYMCGSDLESKGGAASRDLVEMANSGFNSDDVNLVILTGGAKQWAIDFIPNGEASMFLLKNDSLFTLERFGSEYSMGDPNLLYSFMEMSYDTFPAEKYALVLWDHGGGSLMGVCVDEVHDGDLLGMGELAAALRAATESRDKLEWIGFDACLMASAEVANMLRPYANYLVASEEVEPGLGWDYSFLKGIENDASGAQTGKRIIDAYFEGTGANYNGALTLSCIDLSQVGGALNAAGDIFNTVSEILNAENFADASGVRRNARGFGRNESSSTSDYDLVDLGDLLEGYAGDLPMMDAFNRAMESAVVYSRSNLSGCTGLSVYHAFYNKGLYSQCREFYPSLSISQDYDGYLDKFTSFLMGGTSTNWNNLETLFGQGIDRDVRTILSLRLTLEQFKELAGAQLVALQQGATEGSYHLVARQDTGAMQNDDGSYTIGGEYVHTNLFVVNAEGEPIWELPLLYVVDDNGAYQVDVQLVREGEEPVYARLICTRDTNQVSIDSVWLYDEITGVYSPRSMTSLDAYDTVIFSQTDRSETRDESGALLPFDEWTFVANNTYSCPAQGDWQLAFVHDHLNVAELYVAFEMTDIFNDRYTSNPVVLSGGKSDAPGLIVSYDDLELLLLNAETVTLATTSDGTGIRLSAHVTNISESEAIVYVQNVRVNGVNVSAEAAIYGMGNFDGLLPEETQMMRLTVNGDELAGAQTIETIEFDLVLVDEAENELGVVPVTVTANYTL